MNLSSQQLPPEEPEIERLLSRYKPRPSEQFYQRMQSAPWEKILSSGVTPAPTIRKLHRPLLWGIAVLIIFLLVGAIVLIPPVRTVARQIFYSFLAVPSNQIDVQVTRSSPEGLFDYSDPANFTLSVEQAQAQAGFQLRQITTPVAGLNLVGAHYDPSYNAVIMLYQGDNFALFLTQRPLENSQDVFSVGEGASVEIVLIGEIRGEFVRGGWKAVSTQPAIDSQPPTTTVTISATWDENLPQATLRWQADDVAYELRAVGEGSPSQSELITVANGLK
jgi:hypothetical protein